MSLKVHESPTLKEKKNYTSWFKNEWSFVQLVSKCSTFLFLLNKRVVWWQVAFKVFCCYFIIFPTFFDFYFCLLGAKWSIFLPNCQVAVWIRFETGKLPAVQGTFHILRQPRWREVMFVKSDYTGSVAVLVLIFSSVEGVIHIHLTQTPVSPQSHQTDCQHLQYNADRQHMTEGFFI